MELKECYEIMGADYQEVFGRLRADDRIKRFLNLFVKDESFCLLQTSMDAQDYQTAFRAAHTLKGVAMNLSLTKLANSSSALTEALRDGEPKGDVGAMFETVKADHQLAVETIGKLS